MMTCYGIYDNAVKTLSQDHILCSSNTTSSSLSSSPPLYCCASGTTCVGDSICHFTPPTSKTSGYYIGSCTDESFNSSACSRECCKSSLPPDFCVNLRRRTVENRC